LNSERLKLAAAEIPSSLDRESRTEIRMAILESFVFGFRRVMLVGAGLALFGSLLAWLTIRSR
jgi:hypothetical protein